jgi:hypothetical protein
VSSLEFDDDQVFDEDYLYFYGPGLEEVADDNCELIWRLLELRPGCCKPAFATWTSSMIRAAP